LAEKGRSEGVGVGVGTGSGPLWLGEVVVEAPRGVEVYKVGPPSFTYDV